MKGTPSSAKTSQQSIIFTVVLLGLLYIIGSFVFLNKELFQKTGDTIVVGEGNPGNIALYTKEDKEYTKKIIPTGFRFVYTVRLADVRGEGRNRLYAGVSNGYHTKSPDCQVIELDPKNNFSIEVIDRVNDLRCKDLAVGDVDNDGRMDLLHGSHGFGVITMYTWENNAWKKRELDRNYTAEFDRKNSTDHKVPIPAMPQAIVQTAVHVLRVGDSDNDGKNELVATISDPLEYPGKDHKLFITLFRVGSEIKREIIDTLSEEIPFKATVKIEDIDEDGKNEVLVGASHHSLILYRYKNGKWEKQVLDKETGGLEDNMKGLVVGKFGKETKNTIILGTGSPQAAVYQYQLENGKVAKKQLVNISKLLDTYRLFKGIGDNTLDIAFVDIDSDGRKEIVASGLQDTSLMADQLSLPKFGFEATTIGYTVVITKQGDSYKTELLDTRSGLAMDTGVLSP